MSSGFPDVAPVSCSSSDAATSCLLLHQTLLSLGFLCRYSILVAPDASSRTSGLSRFLVQHCPWPTFSVASVQLSALYACVPYAVPLLHGGSSFCGQWPTSSGTHDCPGFISPADRCVLWLDASPYGPSSVL
jgi:hypothetical protein